MSRIAVRSHISLCLMDGKPPLAHDRACSTEREAPQTHFDGSLSGVQPYCRARASWKAPCSVSGMTVSQVQRFTDLRRFSGRWSVRSHASFELFFLFSCLTKALDSNCLDMMSYP